MAQDYTQRLNEWRKNHGLANPLPESVERIRRALRDPQGTRGNYTPKPTAISEPVVAQEPANLEEAASDLANLPHKKSDYVVILVRAPYSNAKDGEFIPYKLGLRVQSVKSSGGSANELTTLIRSLSEQSGIPIESETPDIKLLTSENLTNLLHNLGYNSNASLAGVYDGFAQLKVPAGHAVHILPKRDLRTYLTETPIPNNN